LITFFSKKKILSIFSVFIMTLTDNNQNAFNGTVNTKPRILVSNDDGVNAPGLVALARALHQQNDHLDFCVCGPSGERSARSHAITVDKQLNVFNIDVLGAEEAFAVDGTPADSVMLALNCPLLLTNNNFDLVVTGINRGDNCGLHVIYSGTVGAAREAACKGIPAIALSLDDYRARSVEGYEHAATQAVALIKSILGLLPSIPPTLSSFSSLVINVNFPGIHKQSHKGFHICTQGKHCHFPDFMEIEPDSQYIHEGEHSTVQMGKVILRGFRNKAGYLQTDDTPGCDSWAVENGWTSVTLQGLMSDVPLTKIAAVEKCMEETYKALESAVSAAAESIDLEFKTAANM
jgi:5'-nucleotidase